MNRRTFLRVLGSAAVGIAIAPAVLIEPASARTWWSSRTGGMDRPLTLEMMREAFEMCSRGPGNRPNYIITTRAVAEKYATLARSCGLVFDMDITA